MNWFTKLAQQQTLDHIKDGLSVVNDLIYEKGAHDHADVINMMTNVDEEIRNIIDPLLDDIVETMIDYYENIVTNSEQQLFRSISIPCQYPKLKLITIHYTCTVRYSGDPNNEKGTMYVTASLLKRSQFNRSTDNKYIRIEQPTHDYVKSQLINESIHLIKTALSPDLVKSIIDSHNQYFMNQITTESYLNNLFNRYPYLMELIRQYIPHEIRNVNNQNKDIIPIFQQLPYPALVSLSRYMQNMATQAEQRATEQHNQSTSTVNNEGSNELV